MTMKNNMEKMNKQEQIGHIVVNACKDSKEESSYMENRFYVMGKYWEELYISKVMRSEGWKPQARKISQ
ncbi:MAG: hypothetical protein ACLQO7_02205 [Candidatus Bathyarchaeia archaeon]